MISIHLSDQEITAAAGGERELRAAHHLQICADCQQQVEMYRERMLLNQFRNVPISPR